MFARAWRTWKRFAHALGNFQARVILTLFYFVIAVPFGVLAKVIGDPLRVRRPKKSSSSSYWLSRPHNDDTLQATNREF